VQGPLIADGRNSKEKFILPTGLLKDTLGISKLMKVSLPNFTDKDFRSKESSEKIGFPTSKTWQFLAKGPCFLF
jgi:hypothetical protein